MNKEDFSYVRCKCGNIHFVKIKYNDGNDTILSNLCTGYRETDKCCDKPLHTFCSINIGLRNGYIKESDLPEVLRDKMEVTYEECNGPRMIMKRCNKRTDVTIVKDKIRIIREGRQVYETDIF